MPHALLKDAIAALRENEEITRDKWLTLAAWKTLLYAHYDFESGPGLSLTQLLKGLALFGPISDKVSAGNGTIIHYRRSRNFERKSRQQETSG